jgi:hypothetical protein
MIVVFGVFPAAFCTDVSLLSAHSQQGNVS